MQKRLGILGIFLIVLMFVFSSGFVFADDYQRLKINSINYAESFGLSVDFIDSITPSVDTGSNWWSRNTIFSTSYEIEDYSEKYYMTIYLKNRVSEEVVNKLKNIISDALFQKNYATILDSGYTYDTVCLDSKNEFINDLSQASGIPLKSNDVVCGYSDTKSPLIINNTNVKDKQNGAFIIVILKYNVTKNEYLGEYSSANLEEIIEYDGDFRGKFIEKGDLIFTEKNYFAQFNYYPLPVNSSSEDSDSSESSSSSSSEDSDSSESSSSSSSEDSDSSESSSSSSSQSNNFSINFKEDMKTENIICEKDKKLCYVKLNQNIYLDLIANKVNDGNVYFAINNLTNNSNLSFNNPTLISNNLKLGNNLINYNSENTEFKVNLSQSITGNYIISSKQDNTNIDKLYFVFLPDENFEDLVKYKTLQKIINSVYCDGCKIPDWMPNGLIIDNQTENLSTSDPNCKYTGDFKILCDFSFFDLNQDINYYKIFNTGPNAEENFKKTFFLEIEHRYSLLNANNVNKNDDVKLFFRELNNFGLTENEQKIFFSIIGGESSFVHNKKSGLNENSFGYVQINESWNNKTSYDQIEKYLPEKHKGFTKYQSYFTNISAVTSEYSLYLGLAVFKYHLNIMKSTTAKPFNNYTDVERAFIQFYKHQLRLDYAETFFNGYNPKNKMIFNCDPNAPMNSLPLWKHDSQDKVRNQAVAYNKLECVSTGGSVRKLAWYLYANKHWDTLKGEGNNLNGTTSTDIVNLPYVMSGTSKLYIHTTDAPTTLNWDNAKKYCEDLDSLGYDDWYLPSKEQMTAIWNACDDQSKSNACMNNNIKNQISGWSDIIDSTYWTKNEYSSSNAYRFVMNVGIIYYSNKSFNGSVRCVRDH
jgi:hypothetical protein